MRGKTFLCGLLMWTLATGMGAQPPLESAPATMVAVGDFGVLPQVRGPLDNRFFGTYCQERERKFCKDVRLFPNPCVTLRELAVHLDHVATGGGSRILGRGSFTLDSETGFVAVAGLVTARGSARLVARAPGLGVERGTATLSSDGLVLSTAAFGETIELRKDACDNERPRVEISVVGGPEFEHREVVTFGSEVVDEDEVFPVDRLVFSSDRQGILAGNRLRGGKTLITSSLLPGEHQISLTAIDSGGLTGSDSILVLVVNEPPAASILEPAPDASVQATAPVLLKGRATDREDGLLHGSRLSWAIETEPGAGFVGVGTGALVTAVFPRATSAARIRLTARDASGETGTETIAVTVSDFSGNAPPVVAIQQPEQLFDNRFALVTSAGTPVRFEATAADVEDPPDALGLEWQFFALAGDVPDPTPTVPNPPSVEGELVTEVTFGNVGDVAYRVVFSATDTQGVRTSTSVDLFVLAQPVQ